MFATFSIWLNNHSIQFVTDLVTTLPKAYTSSMTCPFGTFLSKIYNWKGFFAPFLPQLQGISSAHVFLF